MLYTLQITTCAAATSLSGVAASSSNPPALSESVSGAPMKDVVP